MDSQEHLAHVGPTWGWDLPKPNPRGWDLPTPPLLLLLLLPNSSKQSAISRLPDHPRLPRTPVTLPRPPPETSQPPGTSPERRHHLQLRPNPTRNPENNRGAKTPLRAEPDHPAAPYRPPGAGDGDWTLNGPPETPQKPSLSLCKFSADSGATVTLQKLPEALAPTAEPPGPLNNPQEVAVGPPDLQLPSRAFPGRYQDPASSPE